jgi:hypothetical protein
LTAGNIVDDCLSVVVTKEGRVLPAQVEAFSRQPDLALVKVSTTLGLAAVFPRDITASANDMVFAAAYDSLPVMIAAGNILSNATVVAEDAGSGFLSIDSSVTFGASGAPVLDGRALVQGVISRRTRKITWMPSAPHRRRPFWKRTELRSRRTIDRRSRHWAREPIAPPRFRRILPVSNLE